MKFYKKRIPLENEIKSIIISAIEDADYLYSEYIKKECFLTRNGGEGLRWNYINRQIRDILPSDRFQTAVLNRGPWQFLGIYDCETGYLYTLMREKNLKTLRKNAKTKVTHYLNALSKLNDDLNKEFAVENEQLCFFPDMMSNEKVNESLEQILQNFTAEIDGAIKRYALIAFDIAHGHVVSIKAVVPAVGMNYYKEENWLSHAPVAYPIDDMGGVEEVSDDVVMIEPAVNLKRRKDEEDIKARQE